MGIAGGIAAAGVVSAGVGAYSSSQAAGAASKSANQSAQLQQETTYQNALRNQPYVNVGYDAANQLDALNASGFTAGQPDDLAQAAANVPNANNMANLVNTPGYQFNLQQGLQATQNSAAARGLGVSGAAMKGAATFATGLADNTYQNQFNNQQSKYTDYLNLNSGQQQNAQNLYNRLSGTATLGENAATQTGAQSVQSSANAGNYLNQAGQATAAGYTGVGNAISGSANNAVNAYQQQNYLKTLQANQNAAANGSAYVDSGTWD